MKLRANKGGNGYLTNYTVSIATKEARSAGLVNEDGTSKSIKKIVDEVNHCIIIALEQDQPTK